MKELKILPIALFFALLFACTSLMAQTPAKKKKADRQDRIEQLKIAYFTQELDMTPEEAEKFWPVYNEFDEKLKAKKKAQRKENKELKEGFETLTDDEIKTKSESILDNGVEQAELKKEYHGKIAKVLGYKKATKLLSLEQQFKKELLKRLNGQQKSQPARGKQQPKRPTP